MTPVPEMVRFNARVTTAAEKVADTFLASLIVTVQVEDVPAQAPPQPAKANPAEGAATNVTVLPLLKVLAQLAEQELPSEKPTPPVPAIVRFKPKGVGVAEVGLKKQALKVPRSGSPKTVLVQGVPPVKLRGLVQVERAP